MPALEVRSISVSYGHVGALHEVSLDVPEASVVALIGSNGAGKTTMMRAITNLARISTGEIRFGGKRIDHLRPSEVAAMGIALSPEGRRLFPRMSVLDNLFVGAHCIRDRAVVRESIECIFRHFPRLEERRRQLAGSLSGGEQQMVAIGRALMAQPKLLLLDEPSLGLAPKMVEEIARIVTDISREGGLSILLVEQNARMALRLSDFAYVLERGRIVLSGPGTDLLASEFVQKAYLGV